MWTLLDSGLNTQAIKRHFEDNQGNGEYISDIRLY